MQYRSAPGFSLIEMLLVVAIIGTLAAIALPMTGNAVKYAKISGDARDLSNELAVAKMRAASKFTQARVYVDLIAKQYQLQTCHDPTTLPCKPLSGSIPAWDTDGSWVPLARTVSFGYGTASAAPTNTQTTIGQASLCKDGPFNAPVVDVANTACIIFNSRGIPVDASGNPTGNYALYINDSTLMYGVTVAATGFIRVWQSPYVSTPTWVQQ